LHEDLGVAEELNQQDSDRPQRRDVEPHEAEHEPADDRERQQADLDGDAETGEQNVAPVPDEALPVARLQAIQHLAKLRGNAGLIATREPNSVR
jgi:hypothetical protein